MAPPVDVPGPLLSAEERQKLHALIEDADSVELKLTVPEADQRSTVQALGLDPLQAEIRQVFFLDTPELSLDQSGLVVRARRSQKKGDDSVVKLRPVVPSELSRSIRKAQSFSIEVDASPSGFVCSGSMKGVPVTGNVHRAVSGSDRCASCSRRSSELCSRRMPPTGSGSTTSRSSAPSSSSSSSTHRTASGARWSWRCGSIRMGHGSWSSRPSACRRRPSTWPRTLADFSRRKV